MKGGASREQSEKQGKGDPQHFRAMRERLPRQGISLLLTYQVDSSESASLPFTPQSLLLITQSRNGLWAPSPWTAPQPGRSPATWMSSGCCYLSASATRLRTGAGTPKNHCTQKSWVHVAKMYSMETGFVYLVQSLLFYWCYLSENITLENPKI